MNTLYEAVMILGRAVNMIDQDRWTRGSIGTTDNRMCAAGLITYGAGQHPSYITAATRRCAIPEVGQAMHLASDALRRAATPEQVEAAINDALENRQIAVDYGEKPGELLVHDQYIASLRRARDGSDNLRDIEKLIVHVNDRGIPDETNGGRMVARQWFSDAIDLLAEQLPTPASPVVPEATGAPLVTV